MKKVLAVVLGLAAFGANAQDFKPFKVNSSIGYAKPSGAGASGGILISAEPKYGITDQIDVGLRFEGAAMVRAITINEEVGESELKLSGSYVLTGTYLLTTTYFRPYVGLGVGLYSTGGIGVTDGTSASDDISIEASRKPGAMARIGFKLGHFNMGAEYNLVPSTKYSLATGAKIQGSNSYLGIKLGFDIGGGFYE